MWTREPGGMRYPRLREFSTDRQPDGSTYITRVLLIPPFNRADFELPPDLRRQFIAARRRIADFPFGPTGTTDRPVRQLAPGIVKVPGRFDIVEVEQDDGIVIIEAPLSSEYSAQAIADPRQRFGGMPIKAVITTSDAWPQLRVGLLPSPLSEEHETRSLCLLLLCHIPVRPQQSVLRRARPAGYSGPSW